MLHSLEQGIEDRANQNYISGGKTGGDRPAPICDGGSTGSGSDDGDE